MCWYNFKKLRQDMHVEKIIFTIYLHILVTNILN